MPAPSPSVLDSPAARRQDAPVQKFNVHIDDTGERYACGDHRSLLEGMLALDRKGIPVGCRNGGCGVCKVAILSGACVAGTMSREHLSEAERQQGLVLACKAKPVSDIHLAVVGRMKKSVCR